MNDRVADNRIMNIAQQYAELVIQRYGPCAVYLYGSYAKGTNTADSDIDIAVVGDRLTGDSCQDVLDLMRLRRQIDMRIEPHPFQTIDFSPSNPYVKEILETGIRIA
jgi:uncharacterized protein